MVATWPSLADNPPAYFDHLTAWVDANIVRPLLDQVFTALFERPAIELVTDGMSLADLVAASMPDAPPPEKEKPLTEAQLKVIDNFRRWRGDVVAFVREMFGAEPDAWQKKTLEAVILNMRVAMQACKGPGKSTLLAWVAWWFLVVFPHPKIAATSISEANLKDGLWAEMSKWQKKNTFLKDNFTWTAERIFAKGHHETWWMSARNWPKTADATKQADTLAGLHADFLLFIVDEAGGIPVAVGATAEAGLANASPEMGTDAKFLIAGNPTQLEGLLYHCCVKKRDMWWVIEVSSAPDDPNRTPRVSKKWAQDQIKAFGVESPFVLVNVFGRFPPGSLDTLIARELAVAASERKLGKAEFIHEGIALGVDVARFGDDATVIIKRQGRLVTVLKVARNLDTMETADQVVFFIADLKPDAVFVDGIGVGSGVVDRLRQLGHDVVDVQSGGKAVLRKPAVRNKRVEMWWLMREWLKHGSIPNDETLLDELGAPKYWFNAAGEICLESKEEMKQRGVESPNIADAIAMTFAAPFEKRSPLSDLPGHDVRGRAVTEFDPLGG